MGRKSKYELLDNKDWLYQKYVVEGLSTNQIANLGKAASPYSVGFRLKKYGIPMRNMSEARTQKNYIKFIFDKEIIEGSLLGDGSLKVGGRERDKKSKIRIPCFRKTNVGYDHILYVANALCGEDAKSKIKEWYNKNGNRYFSFSTKHTKELSFLFQEWYPEWNNYEKVIPKTLDLTPKVLLNWFLDDGTTSFRKNRNSKQIRMIFCSESFTKTDNEWLCNQLFTKYKIGAKIQRKPNAGYGWRIYIPTLYISKVYEIMGECPVSSLRYKWK